MSDDPLAPAPAHRRSGPPPPPPVPQASPQPPAALAPPAPPASPADADRHLWLVPPPSAARLPPPADALAELDALLARAPRDDADLARLAALAEHVPGRARDVVAALDAAGTGAALDALLGLARAPGAETALARAVARGVTRRMPGGAASPVFLALEFRSSRAAAFPALVRRAQHLAADPTGAVTLEVLRVDDRPRYRLAVWPERLDARARRALARHGADLGHLHAHLLRLRGARLWLNGFCMPEGGPVPPPVQARLLGAFLTWLNRQDP